MVEELNWVSSLSFLYWIHVGRIRAWHLTETATSYTNLDNFVASHGLFKPASKQISILPPLDLVNLSSIIPDVCFLLHLGASPTTNIGSVSVHQIVRLHIKKHATLTWLQQLPSCCLSSQGSSDLTNSSCVKSASEVVSSGKGDWERAASWVDKRVTRAAGGTMEGVATTRAISACLVVAISFYLACFAARVARETVLYNFLLDFDLLLHHQYQQNLHNSSASVSVCP